MLQKLSIKNFAIIENSSLEFSQGFNVVIGETGAGKSIILDALKFVLGNKAQKEDIRYGETELSVKATFINLQDETISLLKDFSIDYDDDVLIITRVYNVEGKSSCRINGEVVTVSMLKQLGDTLYDMYGQHDSVQLLNTKNHLKLLDSYDDSYILNEKDKIKSLLLAKKNIDLKIEDIGGANDDRERTLDLLRYQIDEINNANLFVGEDEKLEEQITTLSNSEKISSALDNAIQSLSYTQISNAVASLLSISNLSPTLSQLSDRLKGLEIDIEDILSSLKDVSASLEFEEQDLDNLVLRQEQIKTLKRKYGATIEDVLAFAKTTQDRYDTILNSEKELEKLNNEKQKIISELYKESIALHQKRVEIANTLEKSVAKQLQDLGMENTTFKVDFAEIGQDDTDFTTDGLDKVEFLFSANRGEKEKSLSKTISGGEMSRFMLALRTVLGTKDSKKTLVFDEIDTGVSGEIGYKVGEKLYTLSTSSQILCITHLPQVTALADKHIFVYKKVIDDKTYSEAKYLSKSELINYLSTLLGGYDSKTSKLHAEELLTLANNKKRDLNK